MNPWHPVTKKPEVAKRVLVWHRVRKASRFFQADVGCWNSEEWRRPTTEWNSEPIYKPTLWQEIIPPTK